MTLTPQSPDHPPERQLIIKLVICMPGSCPCVFYLHQPLRSHHPHIRGAHVIITRQAQKWRLGEPKSAAKVLSGKRQGRDRDPCGA